MTKRLTKKIRASVKHLLYEGYSVEEIAHKLDLTEAQVIKAFEV